MGKVAQIPPTRSRKEANRCPEPDALPDAPDAGLRAVQAGTHAQLVAGLPGALHAGHPEWEVAELLAEPGAVPLDAGREAGLAELRAIDIRTIE